ncbi:response regulator [Rhodocytophaga rosea]|uniref:Response regulator n=1 Tax=Rhodocytophaga rosea TaxID=2704465 RepID=A0A6C0GV99_9BACT|nr:response regulator [Rhodocytophaga rosea]QHT71744.1 response regulator [Rhodocytophaga rosea]
MSKPQILVIDDEGQIRKLLEITLESSGYTVMEAATGKAGLIAAATHPPDLILLDLGLPDESGHQVLVKLREWYSKAIILSVQDGEKNIIQALDNGANDYLTKPFRTGELLARIRSSLRTSSSIEFTPLLEVNGLSIDFIARNVKKNQQLVKLTATEYTLLALFAKNEGKVLTHHYLLKEVWGPGYIHETQYLRVFIAQLRKKIEDNPNQPTYILTESGVGYRFLAKE